MPSLFPKLDIKTASYVLRGRMPVVTPEVDAAARTLQELGLIDVRRFEYIRCAFELDGDYDDLEDKECSGIASLKRPAPYRCSECKRRIDFPRVHKTVFRELYAEVNTQGVLDYFCRVLREVDAYVVSRTVWTVRGRRRDKQEFFIVLDEWAGPLWRPRGPDASIPRIYVYADFLRMPEPGIRGGCFVRLASFLAHDKAWVAKLIAECDKREGVIE